VVAVALQEVEELGAAGKNKKRICPVYLRQVNALGTEEKRLLVFPNEVLTLTVGPEKFVGNAHLYHT
jgi:hypothetical protein